MSKIFRYTKIYSSAYLSDSDEFEEYGDEFEYEPSEEELKRELVDLLYYEYFSKEDIDGFTENQEEAIKKALKNFTDDNDNWEDLYDAYEESLMSIFEEDALEQFK